MGLLWPLPAPLGLPLSVCPGLLRLPLCRCPSALASSSCRFSPVLCLALWSASTSGADVYRKAATRALTSARRTYWRRTRAHVPPSATGGLWWACCRSVGHCCCGRQPTGTTVAPTRRPQGPGPAAATRPSHSRATTRAHQGLTHFLKSRATYNTTLPIESLVEATGGAAAGFYAPPTPAPP